MTIKKIDNVSCSLNLGLIYSLNYNYTPEEGIKISIFFVNESGIYNKPLLTTATKTAITIGEMSFSMCPIKYALQIAFGRRVIKVDFVDDTFRLENYYIVLTGTGCGLNVYQLGVSVDPRTTTDINNQTLDTYAESIKNQTQNLDLEYHFSDFLIILGQVFNVAVSATYDNTLTKPYIGTFKEVLNSWCNYYNLSWFFENGILKIFDPSKLIINFAQFPPQDAIDYEYEESLEDTYGKTIWANFTQEGGQYGANGYIQTASLYPNGADLSMTQSIEADLAQSQASVLGDFGNQSNDNIDTSQITLNLNQVVAAMYGQQFWFLYNYSQGTASTECGWTPLQNTAFPTTTTISDTISNLGCKIAILDQDIFNQKYQAYSQYGASIAGKYYLSDIRSNIENDKLYTWYNVTNGQIFDFQSQQADEQKISVDYLLPQDGTIQVVDGTNINQYFDGIKYIRNRIVYKDSTLDNSSKFVLSNDTNSLVSQAFNQIFNGPEGNQSFDFSIIGNQKYVAYYDINLDQSIVTVINGVAAQTALLTPNFTPILNIIGISTNELQSQNNIAAQPTVTIVGATPGTTSVTSNSTIALINPVDHTVYYQKYNQCISASSNGNYFKRVFNSKSISSDTPTPTTVTTSQNNYNLTRNLNYVNVQANQTLLQYLAQPRTFNTITVSFGLNYFYEQIPINYLTGGLINLSITVSDEGINSKYTFSNQILKSSVSDAFLEKLELNMKNSWIRKYNPPITASI